MTSNEQQSQGSGGVSRRRFVQASAAATAGMLVGPRAYAQGSDVLRVGLIGCGGRGTGAARDCLTGSEGVRLVALGDVFRDRIDRCHESLTRIAAEQPEFAAKLDLAEERMFTGFDAYRQVIAAEVDLVLIATPPAFRPAHVAAAVEAGKHIFMEKPVAVDPVGVRSIMASADAASRRGLAIVAGTQRRHDPGYRATIEMIHDGAIGDVIAAQVYWNQGGLWHRPREPEWSDTEWQLRNWLYFTWLSGDHIVEQHIHNLDVANWVMQSPPVRAVGVGGRQWRTDPAFGHVYDHFAIDFEYPNGARVMSMCRQIDGTASFVGERILGSKGRSDAHSWIEAANGTRFETRGGEVNPYVQEHVHLVAGIRSGRVLNEGRQVAESTLTAIMGREAAYTGQAVTWDDIMHAELNLVPSHVAFGPMAVDPVAIPGETVLHRTREGV